MPSPQSRSYVFTINNPTDSGDSLKEKMLAEADVKYAIFQLEVGETGTPHFQGYVEFTKPRTMAWCQNHLLRGHYEKRRGTRAQAKDYASKEETRTEGPWEVGEWRAASQGRRTDIDSAASTLKERGLQAVVEEHLTEFIKFSRGFNEAASRLAQRFRDQAPKVYLLFGDPGCGKTRYVVDNHTESDLYIHEPGSKWFDGYESHPVLLLDDFAGSSSGFRLDYTLRLLDRYSLRLPIKGSHVYLVAKKIYITTNIHPYQWFSWNEREIQYRALARRIHHVICFNAEQRPYYADRDAFFGLPHGPMPGSNYCRPTELEESTDEL